MNQRRCPYCGEYVQKSSITCPKCFREIPRETEDVSEYVIKDDNKGRKRKAPKTAVLLSVIPPFVGLLGLGMIYLDHKNRAGYWFLLTGLLLFLTITALFFVMRGSGILSAFLLFAVMGLLLVIYILSALAALLETMFGSVFKVLRL